MLSMIGMADCILYIKRLITTLTIFIGVVTFSSSIIKAQGLDYSDLNNNYSRLSHAVPANIDMYIGSSVDADNITSWTSLDADDDSDDSYAILPDLTRTDILFHMSPRCTNNSGAEAILAMWLDVDSDGLFESDEIAIASVPNGTNNEEIDIVFRRSEPFLDSSSSIVEDRVAMRFTIAPNIEFNYDGSIDKQYDNGESEDFWISITETCERVDKKKWFFADRLGLDFNQIQSDNSNDPNFYPTAISGLTITNEGSGAVTTHWGDVVTYTDGDNLWRIDDNNVHYVSEDTNGDPYSLGGHSSSTQGALFIKAPQRNDFYYIFANPAIGKGIGAAYYSVTDLSKDGGTGSYAKGSFILNGSLKGCSVNGGNDIIQSVPIQGIDGTSKMSELITGIESPDRSIKWIILHGQSSDSRFYIARIDVDGMTWTSQEMDFEIESCGTMRISPDGRTIIICSGQTIMMYDFNTETGVVSNERILANSDGSNGALTTINPSDVNTTNMTRVPDNANYQYQYLSKPANGDISIPIKSGSSLDNLAFYGAEFTSSGKILYVTANGHGGTSKALNEPGNIYQFDFSDRSAPYLHTLFCIRNITSDPSHNEKKYGIGTVQRGDDYKIYFVDPGSQFVGAIDNPDILGNSCGINCEAIDISVLSNGSNNVQTPDGPVSVTRPYVIMGLPNFISNTDLIQCGLYDFGDHDPATYGIAAHFSAPLNFLSLGVWCDVDFDITDINNPIAPFSSNYGLGDDYHGGDDEDLDSYFPPLVEGMTEYTFWVPVETDKTTFTVSAWIDFDSSGTFDNGEIATQDIIPTTLLFENDNINGVLNSNGNVKLTWSVPSNLNSGDYKARFRVATDPTEVSSPTGVAADGEVEDHIITVLDSSNKIITFDLDGGVEAPNPSPSFSYQMSYLVGESGSVPPIPSKTDYSFSHWEYKETLELSADFDNDRGAGTYVGGTGPTTYRYTQDQQQTGYASAYNMPGANVTLTAIWIADTDNDGIAPDIDLDDDNDGILDVDEQDEIASSTVTIISSNGSTTNSNRATDANDTGNQGYGRLQNGGEIVVEVDGIVQMGDDIELVMRRNNSNNNSILLHVSTSLDNISYTTVTDIDVTSTSITDYTYTLTANVRYIKIEAETVSSQQIRFYGVKYSYGSDRDTDGDGTVDRLDTDSDDDGCFDADEAYQTVTADIDENGMYGSEDPEVEIYGRVVSASYGYSTANLATAYDNTNSICDNSDMDYGDAPDSYNTNASNIIVSTAHSILNYDSNSYTSDLMLGSTIDIESGLPSTPLDGTNDDTDASDDEDGVSSITPRLIANNNISVSFTNLTGGIVYISGFIDFDRNGTFESDEMASSSVNLSNGTITLNWQGLGSTIDVDPGSSYARFRIGSILSEVEQPYGEAIDGEVEDYPIDIAGQLIFEDGVDNEDIAVPTSYRHTYLSLVDISNTEPIRPNYKFVSWMSSSSYIEDNVTLITIGDLFYPGDQDIFRMPRKNVTLTAQWEDDVELTTTSVNNINSTTAQFNGKVESAVDIVEHGFIYSFNINSTADLIYDTSNSNISIETVGNHSPAVDNSTIGEYSSVLTYYTNNIRKSCYFRSFIKTTEGRYYYGDIIRFISELRDLSLYLDGSDDFLVVDSYSTTNSINRWGSSNTFSIDFWVKKIDSNNSYILDNRSAGGYAVEINSSGTVSLYNNSNQVVVASTLNIDDSWHHIAITHKAESSNSIANIYIDGVDCTDAQSNNLNAPNDQARLIIGDSKDGNLGFNGYIDELRFWNIELTEAQSEKLAYSLVVDSSGDVELVGSGEVVAGLIWSNLLASFGFNVKSTLESTNSVVDIRGLYASQDEARDYPFFHEDSRLNSDANPASILPLYPYSYNVAAVGDAKPSVMLPRVNWKHNATTDKWLNSINWVGGSYPGEGLTTDQTLYLDVSSSVIADDTNFTKFTIINGVVTGAFKPIVDAGTPLEINCLVDNDTPIKSYSVDDGVLNTLTILQSINSSLFIPILKVEDLPNSKIIINGGSIEK